MAHSRDNTDLRHKNDETLKKWLILISLVIIGIIYCAPILSAAGIQKCDDTTFHVGRLVGLAGVWNSPVSFDSFGNNGLMVNISYPWLTMYPMRILYALIGSYVKAYHLYHMILTIITLGIAYYSMNMITQSRSAAYIFAVLYTFSSYRYADVFNRDSLGEAIALTFLPLILLGIYKICFGDYKEWRTLTAGMVLIAYSHILSLCMSAVFVGLVYVLSLVFQNDKWQRCVSMIKATCLSIGLAIAMIVPMLEQFRRNDLFTPEGSGDTLSKSAYRMTEILKFSISNNPAGRGIGALSVAALIIALVMIALRVFSGKHTGDSDDKFAVLIILIGMITCICTSDLIPWQILGDNTPIATLQFVWRLNAYPTLVFAAAFSILISKKMNSTPRSVIILVSIVVLISAGLQYYSLHTQNAKIISDKMIAEEDVATWASENVDYAPVQAKDYRDDHPGNMEYIILDGQEAKKSPTTSERGTRYTQVLDGSDTERTADIPVFRYYRQIVQINGAPASAALSERGTTEITIPSAAEATVTISYRYTMLARLSWLFSILVCVIDTAFVIRRKATQ